MYARPALQSNVMRMSVDVPLWVRLRPIPAGIADPDQNVAQYANLILCMSMHKSMRVRESTLLSTLLLIVTEEVDYRCAVISG